MSQRTDRNRDGRPDVGTHDPHGDLLRVAIDTNFGSHFPDRQEDYVGGALIRRQSDRNFDDRIDLVEDFDAVTQETHPIGRRRLVRWRRGSARSIPEWPAGLSQWAYSGAAAAAFPSAGTLAPLADPFSKQRAFAPLRCARFSTGIIAAFR